MKTFKDLEFMPHPNGPGIVAWMHFPNGYGVSVIRFKVDPGLGLPESWGSCTSDDTEFELAVLKDNRLCYSTHITSDVIGHLKAEDVTRIMAEIQQLEGDK